MSKKKIVGIIGGILVLTVLIVCLCVWGANRSNHSAQSTQQTIEQMDVALNALLMVPEMEEEPAFLKTVDEKNGFEILSFEETENVLRATVKVYAPDLYTMAKNIDANNTFASEEEAMAAINEAIKDAQLVEKQMILEFIRTEDGYKPVITSEFLDALYGGVFKLYDDMLHGN